MTRSPLLQRRLTRVLLAAAVCGALNACAPLVVGGAVVTGMMATDRRTSGIQIEDEGIELRAASRLREALGERGHVNATSYNRQVLLTGEVASAQDQALAEQVVAKVENVRGTVNELAVMGASSLTSRSSDIYISTRVKAAFVDERELSANAFKVVTERGTVFLMGRVTRAEAERATQVTRGISGVLKVVRIFDYLTDEELRQMQPKK
jgi:osmotically-inducible protein OsmY